MRFLRAAAFGCVVGLTALVADTASAVSMGSIGFTILDANGNVIWNGEYAGHQTADPNVYTVYNGSGSVPGVLTLDWTGVSVDIDPGVSGSWTITNTDPVNTLVFSLVVDAPVLAVAPGSLMFGSSSVTVSDANFSGSAVLSTVSGIAMYNGRIDLAAAPATDLFPALFTLTAPSGGTNSATQSFGVFPGSVPGPAVTGYIGIQHTFSLTPGDRVTLNSTFHVVVPEPGTLALLGLGLCLLVPVVRQRS